MAAADLMPAHPSPRSSYEPVHKATRGRRGAESRLRPRIAPRRRGASILPHGRGPLTPGAALGVRPEANETRRRWIEERTGASLPLVGAHALDGEQMRGKVENAIGAGADASRRRRAAARRRRARPRHLLRTARHHRGRAGTLLRAWHDGAHRAAVSRPASGSTRTAWRGLRPRRRRRGARLRA